MARPGRRTNAALLALLLTTVTTGVAAFGVGGPGPANWVVAVHGASGFGVLLLAPWKSVIVRRGLRRAASRARAGTLWGVGLAVLVTLTIASGTLHAVGGFRGYLGLLPMQVHVGTALAALAVLGAHLVRHRVRLRRRPAETSRRTVLRAAGLVVGSAALYAVAPGADRRETGSHPVGTDRPWAMPVTQWAFDPVPALSGVDWRLRVAGGSWDGRDGVLGLTELSRLPQRSVRAVLDCTGGWYAEQDWRGVALPELLPGGPAMRGLDVVSATGYRRRFPARDIPRLLLATHVGGSPLSVGHGAPARLVAPGRRGFWWVKWVVRIEPVDEPWWWQPPFPLP